MRIIDSDIKAKLEEMSFRPFVLFEFTIDSTAYYYTNCDVPISYNSNIYSPVGFKVDPIRYGGSEIVDKVNISIDNINEVMTGLFVGSSVQGSDAKVSLIVIDDDGSIIGDTVAVMFEGVIDAWGLDEEKLSVTLVNQFVQWNQRTLALHSKSCRWKLFKGTECGYSGPVTWCDRTYEHCSQLGNTNNFGGFRWLPSMVDKAIWWGRERGELK